VGKCISKIFFVSLFLFAELLFAQNNISKILRKGIEASYSFQLEKADSLFENYIENFPQSPYGYHYLSQLHLWYFLGSRDESERLIYEKYSQIAEKKAEAIEDKNNNNAGFHFLLGQIYTLRALNKIFLDERIGALFSSRSAMSEFDKAIDIDSSYYDAYYGIGIFNYTLSFIPSGIRWIISIAGMDADKEKGLENLRRVYKHGTVMKTEAAFHLAQIYADYSAQYDSSLILLDSLTEIYPKNIIFGYEKSVVLIKNKQLDKAAELLNRISKFNFNKFPQTNALIYFQLGNIYFYQNKFEFAIRYYTKFIEQANSLDFVGIAHYRMAICYYFLNKILKSKHELLLSGQGNEDIEADNYAKEKSIELFDSWMSKERERVIIARNNIRAGNYKAVIDSLKYLKNKKSKTELNKAEAVYLSEAFINIDSIDLAFKILKSINCCDFENEKWIEPYSELLLSKIYYLKSKYKESNELLKMADDNNDYEFKEELSARIINLRKKLIRHLY